MDAGRTVLAFGETIQNGGSNGLDTLMGGVMLLLVGVVLLAVGSGRPSRLGAVGLILWGACLVIPVAAGNA